MKKILAGLLSLGYFCNIYAQSIPGNNPVLIGLNQIKNFSAILEGKRSFQYRINDQSLLDQLTHDLINVTDQKSLSAGAPLGTSNWQLHISVDDTQLKHPSLWKQVSDNTYKSLTAPRLGIQMGITNTTNIGMSYLQLKGIDLKYYGVELTQLLTPPQESISVSARFNHTYTSSQNRVRLYTDDLELIASHKYDNLRPYMGAGIIEGRARVDFRDFSDLTFSRQHSTKYFLGIEARYSSIQIAFEVGKIEQQRYQGIKISINN